MFGKMNYEKIFEDIFEKLKKIPDEGKAADYIPELARINPDSFGVHLTTVDGVLYDFAASETRFSVQSIAKVLSFVLADSHLNSKIC